MPRHPADAAIEAMCRPIQPREVVEEKRRIAAEAGTQHLIKKWPLECDEDEDDLAVAIGKLRAYFGV